jgi:hypothetical protein
MGGREPGVGRQQAAAWRPDRGIVVVRGRPARAHKRATPTRCQPWKAAGLDRLGRGWRPPPGSTRGAGVQRGHAGTGARSDAPWGRAGSGRRESSPPRPAGGRGPGTWLGVQTRATPRDRRTRDPGRTPRRGRGRRRGASSRGAAGEGLQAGTGGNRGPRDPRQGRRRRAERSAGRHEGRHGEATTPRQHTPAASAAGEPVASAGDHDAGAPARRGAGAGRLAPDPHGGGAGKRWGARGGVGGAPRGDPHRSGRAVATRTLDGATREADGARPGGWPPAAARDADGRGHNRPAGGAEAVGRGLGAGRSGLLPRGSGRPPPTPGHARVAGAWLPLGGESSIGWPPAGDETSGGNGSRTGASGGASGKGGRRAMTARGQWCRDHRQTPRHVPHRRFCQTRRGPYQDDGLRGHDPRLAPLYAHAAHAWRDWVSRRSRPRAMPWAKVAGRRARSPRPTPTLVQAL